MGAGPGEVGLCGTQGKEGDGPQNTGSQVLSLEDAGAPGERCHGRGQNSGGGFQGEMDCGNPVEGLRAGLQSGSRMGKAGWGSTPIEAVLPTKVKLPFQNGRKPADLKGGKPNGKSDSGPATGAVAR